MKKSKIRLGFISLLMAVYLLRWQGITSPLPIEWQEEDVVQVTMVILENPEARDYDTVVRKGIWMIKMRGFVPLEPGKRYQFVGAAKVTKRGGKVVQVIMDNPRWQEVGAGQLTIGEKLLLKVGDLRAKLVTKLARLLPEPHASLASGILLGVKADLSYDFYQALINSGTLHIVAASGYNVNVAAGSVMAVLTPLAGRYVATGMGVLAIGLYALLAGGSAAVVRAGIMGILTLIAFYFGRQAEAKRLLWVTAGAMIFVNPLLSLDIGFQLSVSAMVGLLYLQEFIEKVLRLPFLKNFVAPTVSASIATLPVTVFWFGRYSLISPISNMLVLPLVPISMFLATLTLIMGRVGAWMLYVPLEIMVKVIEWLG